jgi:hypothetical protein
MVVGCARELILVLIFQSLFLGNVTIRFLSLQNKKQDNRKSYQSSIILQKTLQKLE